MPDDDVLGGAEPATPAQPNGGPAPAVVAANAEADARLSQIEDNQTAMAESLAGMNQFFQGLQQRMADTPPAGAEGPSPTEGDWNEKFYADPQNTIRQEIANETMPVVSAAAKQLSELAIQNEQLKTDAKWGEGAWAKYFEPDLGPVFTELGRTNPAQLMNQPAIQNAIGTVGYKYIDDLREHQSAAQVAATEGETAAVTKLTDAVVSRTNLTGGIRHSASEGKTTLNPDQKDLLGLFQKETGETQDGDRLASIIGVSQDGGTSLEAWEAATAAKKDS